MRGDMTDITDDVDKIEILVADDGPEETTGTTTVVLTNDRGTLTIVGKLTVTEG